MNPRSQFGLCGGVLILINFVLVLIYMPSLLVLEEHGAFKWAHCARLRAHEDESRFHRRLHLLHAALYRSRSIVAFLFGALSAVMIPFAVELLNNRDSSDLEFFGPASEPPPEGLVWGGNSSAFGLGDATYEREPGWPVLYDQVVSGLVFTPGTLPPRRRKGTDTPLHARSCSPLRAH